MVSVLPVFTPKPQTSIWPPDAPKPLPPPKVIVPQPEHRTSACEWVNLSGPFKRTSGFSATFCPTQTVRIPTFFSWSDIVRTAFPSTSILGWEAWCGARFFTPLWRTSMAEISLQIFIHHMEVGDQPVLHVHPSNQYQCCFFFIVLVIKLLFSCISDDSPGWLVYNFIVMLMCSQDKASTAFYFTSSYRTFCPFAFLEVWFWTLRPPSSQMCFLKKALSWCLHSLPNIFHV